MGILVFALAAAAQASTPAPSPEDARAQGYAQAQQALAGNNGASEQGPFAAAPAVEAPSSPASAQSLSLTCAGAGTADKQRGTLFAGRWGLASMISHHDRQFSDQVDVRLFTGDDRIRLPRTMLPGIHGGDAGWFKLKDVVADARSIRASAAVSAFHNPKIYIDRTTGVISISGKDGDYSGQCQAVQANAPAKF